MAKRSTHTQVYDLDLNFSSPEPLPLFFLEDDWFLGERGEFEFILLALTVASEKLKTPFFDSDLLLLLIWNTTAPPAFLGEMGGVRSSLFLFLGVPGLELDREPDLVELVDEEPLPPNIEENRSPKPVEEVCFFPPLGPREIDFDKLDCWLLLSLLLSELLLFWLSLS